MPRFSGYWHLNKFFRFALWLLAGSLLLSASEKLSYAQTTAQITLSGTFSVIWSGSAPGKKNPDLKFYYLTEASGKQTALLLDEKLAQPFGGVAALQGQTVQITGIIGTPRRAGANPPVTVQSLQLISRRVGAGGPAAGPTGAKPYLNLLCRFPDVAALPQSPSYFDNLFNNPGGMNTYWQEVSYNVINLAGSATTTKWYALPNPKAFYLNSGFDATGLLNDCTAAAAADIPAVNFSSYYGINLLFNDVLTDASGNGDYSFGSIVTLNLSGGPARPFGVTWIAPWGYMCYQCGTVYLIGGPAALSHEMGHSLGLNHSTDLLNNQYGNTWDIMSDLWTNCAALTDPTFGCLGKHMVAYAKNYLGWIPVARKYTWDGSTQTISLERLALPTSASYLIAVIPIGGSNTDFYTVEARYRVGYDVRLQADAVIIHKKSGAALLQVQGTDGGLGAAWTVGQTFVDAANNIRIKVDAATVTGFTITINPLLPPSSLTASAFSPTQVNLTWNDNASNETGYRLERKTGVAGTYAEIGSTGPGSGGLVTYSDIGLLSNTTYYYRVRAYNATATSPYSNEANVKTLSKIVTNPQDRGDALDSNLPGTLSFALANSQAGESITFNLSGGGSSVQVSGTLRPVPAGVTVDGGVCGGPGITLDGSGTSNGLTLNGGVILINIKLGHFSGKQIIALGGVGRNQLFCSVARK